MRNSGHNHGSGVRQCCHLIQQPEGEKKNETIHIKYLKSFYIITEHNIRNSPLTFFSLQFEPWWVDGFSNCRSAAWFLIGFLVQQLSPVSDARCSHMKQKGSLKGHLERTLPQPKPSSHEHFLCRALDLASLELTEACVFWDKRHTPPCPAGSCSFNLLLGTQRLVLWGQRYNIARAYVLMPENREHL